MDIITGVLTISAIYLWVLFMDRFFKSCSHYGYIQFLNGTGLEIKVFQFTWTTTAFNNLLSKWGTRRTFLTHWFNLGLCTSLMLLPVAVYLLLLAFAQNFTISDSSEESLLQPIVPGLNLPASELWYYSSTLLLTSVLHEMGHALAAVREDVNLISVGANVIFILPVAFVQLNSDKLFSLNPWKRLKILCAGVWHNLVIALIAYLLFSALPHVFLPFYTIGGGVSVAAIDPRSPVAGERGLHFKDTITQINNCEITNEDAWFKCLNTLYSHKPGFCIQADIIHNLDESINLKTIGGTINCCDSNNKNNLCFEYVDSKDSILEIPPYACLPGRTVIDVSRNFCSSHPHSCPEDSFCFRPVLANNTNLYRIKRTGLDYVIYIGLLTDLGKMVQISSFIPRFLVLGSVVPDVVSKFLKYVVVISMGLAIVNILPCASMDGQHIINTLLHILLGKHLRTQHIKIVAGCVTAFTTLLLVIHCVLVIWTKVS